MYSSLFGSWDEFVLDGRNVVLLLHLADRSTRGLDLAPLVDDELDAAGVSEDLGVAVADGDGSAFLHDIELLVLSEVIHDSVLVTDNALSLSVPSAIISPDLLGNLNGEYLNTNGSAEFSSEYMAVSRGDAPGLKIFSLTLIWAPSA